MAREKVRPIVAAETLGRLLDSEPDLVGKFEGRVHRTQLWRFRTLNAKPTFETASEIEAVTAGRVPVPDWARYLDETPPATPEPEEAAS